MEMRKGRASVRIDRADSGGQRMRRERRRRMRRLGGSRPGGGSPPRGQERVGSDGCTHCGHGEGSARARFAHLACRAAEAAGSFWAFAVALGVVIVWALSGPLFHFSDTWQLVINTGTTVITFLMVFLIQHAQNRDMRAIHLKLNELVGAIAEASDALIDAEALPDDELEKIAQRYRDLAKATRDKALNDA
jgi:low affinity Fe/Cu permease